MRKTWEEFRLLYRYAERKKDLVYSFWCPKWAFWICSMTLNLKASLLKKAFGKTLHKLVSMLEKNGIDQLAGPKLPQSFSLETTQYL